MFLKINTYLKTVPAGRTFVIGLIMILGVAVTTGFVLIQMDQTIAPPGLRVLDWLWRVFVCRCSA